MNGIICSMNLYNQEYIITMKDFYFNELSIMPVADRQTARQIIKNFIYCAAGLRRYGFNALRMTENLNLNNIEIATNYFIYHWREDEEVPRELQTRFRSIVTQVPIINKDDAILQEKAKQTDIYYKNKTVISLTTAYNDNSIVLSFQTDELWKADFIEAELSQLKDDSIEANSVKIRNATQIEHFILHIDWIKNSVTAPDFYCSEPLPFKVISKNLQELDNSNFYDLIVPLLERERIALVKPLAEKIALLNFYSLHKPLTKRNNNRDVFNNLNQDVYLTLDTQHSRFECCNHNGKHQGEFDFYGNQTKKADNSGSHDIYM